MTVHTATTLEGLLGMLGSPPAGYRFFQKPIGSGTTLDVYLVPETAEASAPEALPEGSQLVGQVRYTTHDAAMCDFRTGRLPYSTG